MLVYGARGHAQLKRNEVPSNMDTKVQFIVPQPVHPPKGHNLPDVSKLEKEKKQKSVALTKV